MTKADLINKIADATGLTKLETEAVVEGFIVAVIDALKHGEHVEIRGFGSFRVKERAARKARNPQTGEEIQVPKRMVPVFKVSKEFVRTVDQALKPS